MFGKNSVETGKAKGALGGKTSIVNIIGLSLLAWLFIKWDFSISGNIYLTFGLGAYLAASFFLKKLKSPEAVIFLVAASTFIFLPSQLGNLALPQGTPTAYDYLFLRENISLIAVFQFFAYLIIAILPAFLFARKRGLGREFIFSLTAPLAGIALSVAFADVGFPTSNLLIGEFLQRMHVALFKELISLCLYLSFLFSAFGGQFGADLFRISRGKFLAIVLGIVFLSGIQFNYLHGISGKYGYDWEFFWVAESSGESNPACFPDAFRGNYRFMGAFSSVFFSLWGNLTQRSDMSIIAMFAFLGTIAAFLAYLLSRSLFGESAGTAVLAISVLSTIAPFGRQVTKDYVFQNILSLLFLFFVFIWSKQGDLKSLALAGFFSGLGVYNKVFFLAFLLSFAVSAAVFLRKIYSPKFIGTLLAFFLIGIGPLLAYNVQGHNGHDLPSVMLAKQLLPKDGGNSGYSSGSFLENSVLRIKQLGIFLSSRELTHLKTPSELRERINGRTKFAIFLVAIFLALFLIGKIAEAGDCLQRGDPRFAIPMTFVAFIFASSISYSDTYTSHFLAEAGLLAIFLVFIAWSNKEGKPVFPTTSAVLAILLCAAIFSAIEFPGKIHSSPGNALDGDSFSRLLEKGKVERLAALACAPLYFGGYFSELPYDLIAYPEEYLAGINSPTAIFIQRELDKKSSFGIGFYPENIRGNQTAGESLRKLLLSRENGWEASKIEWTNKDFDLYLVAPRSGND